MASSSSRSKSAPPGVVDVDRGSPDDGTLRKQGVRVSEEEFAERAQERASARDLDKVVVAGASNPRAADRDRAFPRAADSPLSNSRKARPLQHPGITRTPLSSRQRKERSAVKNRVVDTAPKAQFTAVTGLLGERSQKWGRINDALSEANGDAQLLSDADRQEVQRVDRFIQAYEQQSGREHRVYVPVRLPDRATTLREVGEQLPARSLIETDRFTGGVHCLHELDSSRGEHDVVLEVQTRRGAYVGHSDTRDDTRHLLPRAMRLRHVGSRTVSYTRPDGSTGERIVIQARDLTETQQQREKRQATTTRRR